MTLRYPLRIRQGETFQISIPVLDISGNPVSLSGMEVVGQIRAHAADSEVLHEWTTANSGLAIDGNDVILTVPAATSSAWTFRIGKYDIELVDTSGFVTRLVEGYVVVDAEVTRD